MAVHFAKGTPAGAYLSKGSAVTQAWPLTIFAWFNVAALGDYVLSCVTRTDGFADFEFFSLELHGNGEVWAAEAGVGVTSAVGVKGTYTTDTWYTAGAVFADPFSRKAYLNGVGGSTETTQVFTKTLQDTVVGARRLGGENTFRGLTGCAAYVCMWDIALTDGNMATLSDGESLPTDVEEDHIIYFVPLIDVGTDVANQVWDSGSSSMIAAPDLTSHPADGAIETCESSPPIQPPLPPGAGGTRRWLANLGPVNTIT